MTQEIDVIINGETVAQIPMDDRGRGNRIPIDVLFKKASGLNSIVLQSNSLIEEEDSNPDSTQKSTHQFLWI